jgi:hypothetical protein
MRKRGAAAERTSRGETIRAPSADVRCLRTPRVAVDMLAHDKASWNNFLRGRTEHLYSAAECCDIGGAGSNLRQPDGNLLLLGLLRGGPKTLSWAFCFR